ncbi:dihydrodipicolinate synthase family protein [Natronobiforma cellulositropha]|uniref:dihydrodipicolinate synthase family protein n=1 Tax=Natronobiforma cellulositropha TaxID=1679076 RepID=UPI0021D60DC5|nr:dihydrodipicolinate synthase family protein [Natronobiforma cellulositropha]
MTLSDLLCGITTPVVTPFDDGRVDEAAYRDVLEHVEAGGVDAVFPCGTTGEFASLSPGERERVLEVTVEHAEVPVVAGAGATSVAETVAYVETAAEVGADAAVVVPPYFHTANDPEGDRHFFEAVADRVSLPLVLYNIPQCTGQRIEPDVVAELASHERIIGVKDSSGDLEYFQTLLRSTPDSFRCLQGYDPLLVPSLRVGGDGGVNALSNVVPEVYREVFERAHDERGLRLGRDVIGALFEACTAYGFAPATKAALVHRDVLASDEVRSPLVAVDDVTALERTLDDVHRR